MTLRQLTKEEVTFEFLVEDEDIPIRGNLIESGDLEFDKQCEDETINRLEHGELYVWCYCKVIARWICMVLL